VSIEKTKEKNEGLGIIEGVEDLEAKLRVISRTYHRAPFESLADVLQDKALDVLDLGILRCMNKEIVV